MRVPCFVINEHTDLRTMRHSDRRRLAWLQASSKCTLAPSTKQPARSCRQRHPLQVHQPYECRCISTRQLAFAESRKPSLSKRNAEPQVLQRRPTPEANSHVPYLPIKSRPREEETTRESQCSHARRRARFGRDRLQLHLQRTGRGRKGRRVPIESRVMRCT
jgi:hypothetical protein